MSKHLLVSSFEITAKVWVGDTEDGTATEIALPPFKVRPADLAKFVAMTWPQQKQVLAEQVALIELQEVEAQLVAELKRQSNEEAIGLEPTLTSAPGLPNGKAKPKAKKASKKATAQSDAAVRARAFRSEGSPQERPRDPNVT